MKKRKIVNRKFKKKNVIFKKIKVALLLILINNSFHIVDKQVDYHEQIQNIESNLDETNDEFIDFVEDNNIESITITSVGNSIASGYTLNDDVVPLLYRNEELIDELEDITNLNIYNYCRPQNNTDSHILEYMADDAKLSDINEMVRFDLREDSNMDTSSISNANVMKYYGEDNDLTLNNIINSDSDMNIIVYNGCTGKFLDGLTRGGGFSLDYFDDDIKSIDTFCSNVYLTNSKVQIYLCGIPNYFNIGTTKFVNNKIKEISTRYPNVVYVEPAPCKMINKNGNNIIVDIHYNHDEYLILNNNIYSSIKDNYISTMIATDIYNELISLSSEKEFNPDININTQRTIENVISRYPNASNEDISKALKKVKDLVKSNYGSYFCFIPKEDILEYQYKRQTSE